MYKRHTWIISDTHFYHNKIIGYCGRPKDFTRKTMTHWRKMIAPDDLVYHLGDCYFSKASGFHGCMDSLPGIKVLIKGNHDKKNANWYLNHGFAVVQSYAAILVGTNLRKNGEALSYTKVLLSHKPMMIPELEGYKTINIFGHFHDNLLEECEEELVNLLTSQHYLFSLERTKYKPVLLSRAVRDGWVVQFDENTGQWLKR